MWRPAALALLVCRGGQLRALSTALPRAASNGHLKTAAGKAPYQLKCHIGGRTTTEEWLARQPVAEWQRGFAAHGYVSIDAIIDETTLPRYRELYDKFLSQEIQADAHRHDLGSHKDAVQDQVENVTQIMWPSDYVEGLAESVLHERAHAVARALLGDDAAFDFDMLIFKAPHTDTEVPWHQDEGYWLDMPDKRALSIWVALDNANLDNGCMWFGPGSHLEPLREHFPAAQGNHVLMCNMSEAEGVAVPLPAGGCTIHHGRTLHHTRGNSTANPRRAYILNYRPQAMVDWSRSQGFDHGRAGFDEMDYEKAGAAYQNTTSDTKAVKRT